MKTLSAALLILCASLALAGEKLPSLKLTDGTELKDVEITGYSVRGMRAIHSGGGGLILVDLLPEPHKSKCATAGGETEKEYRKRMAAEEKAEAEKKARGEEIVKKTVERLEGGPRPDFPIPPTPMTKIGAMEFRLAAIKPGIITYYDERRAGYKYLIEIRNTSDLPTAFQVELAPVFADGQVMTVAAQTWKIGMKPGEITHIEPTSIAGPGKLGLGSFAASIYTHTGKQIDETITIPENVKELGVFIP